MYKPALEMKQENIVVKHGSHIFFSKQIPGFLKFFKTKFKVLL